MNETILRIARHLRLLLVTMLLVSFLTFLAFELVSGDPARTMLGIEATETQLSVLRHELGLDRPFLARYVLWLCGFFTGDLGISYSYRQCIDSAPCNKIKRHIRISIIITWIL